MLVIRYWLIRMARAGRRVLRGVVRKIFRRPTTPTILDAKDDNLRRHRMRIGAIYGEADPGSVVDWLCGQGCRRVSIYADKDTYENYLPVIISCLTDTRISVKGLYAERRFREEDNVGLSWFYGCCTFHSITKIDPTSTDAILILDPGDTSWTKTLFANTKCRVIQANQLLLESYRQTRKLPRTLHEIRKRVPGAVFLQLNMPIAKADDPFIDASRAQFQALTEIGKLPIHYTKYGFEPADAGVMFQTQLEVVTGRGIAYADYQSKYVNIADGHRVTADQPSDGARRIWFLGGCRVYGICSPDDMTVPSHLQRALNESGQSFTVENYGYNLYGRYHSVAETYANLPIADGDIVIGQVMYPFQPDGVVNTQQAFDKAVPDDVKSWLYSYQSHYTPDGNRLIAQVVYDHLASHGFYAQAPTRQSSDPLEGLPRFKEDLKQYRVPIGSIVMNCNPFTLGHRHLVEQSAAKVDRLYIFVVEEDRSVFPFADRIELVRKGTADLPNVTVVPSGQFIISRITFAEYFAKSELQESMIDPSMDVELFGKEIAPTLGITVRFAGEEPLDKVTDQYNSAMASILPRYGVRFEVIPRVESGGAVISASRVRQLLDNQDFEEIAKLVPPTTLDYLISRYGKGADGDPRDA